MAKVKLTKREVTQEDLDLNPDLVEQGVAVGDMLKLPPLPEKDEGKEVDEDEEDSDESEDSDTEEDSDEEDHAKSSDDVATGSPRKITFKLANPNMQSKVSYRTFDRATHGENFADIAAEFEATNTHKKPVSLTDQKEVAEVTEFNRNIKHPVIGKKVE